MLAETLQNDREGSFGAVHIYEQPPQGGCVFGRQRTGFFRKARLAENPDLIGADIGGFTCAKDLKAASPMGSQAGGEGANNDGRESGVQWIQAHNHTWAQLPDLTSFRRIETHVKDIVSLHSSFHPSGMDSQLAQSSLAAAISLAVSSQDNFLGAFLGRRTISASRSSKRTPFSK
jgi:hypothetical protein